MQADENLLFAFALTFMAGLSTGVGGLAAFANFARKEKFLAFALGLAAGAMIYISFVELLFGALESFQKEGDDAQTAYTKMAVMFLGGLVVTGLLGKFMESITDKMGIKKSDLSNLTAEKSNGNKSKKLYRTGIVTAVALAIHNLPEGLVTFLTSMQDINLGIGIAVAIAIHNIPEGLAVALPIYHATKNKKKALFITLLSGLSEPVGAGIAYLLFFRNMEPEVFDVVNVFVASIMVYVSFFELIPTSIEMGHGTYTKWGIIAGLSVMGLSMIFLT
ncbi:zinc transporter ZupT [Pleomorphovibrio marinus]|uniref:zinc transporter ZupT n=1 Tax=Pleomorphovibrio marinus TaxID=2164132 RepID=UPI000E0A861C|nr:zinc transporter ZupT [Pleomorphovibrio marinus]